MLIGIYILLIFSVSVYADEGKRKYTVGYNPVYHPIQYTGVDQSATGISIEILHQIENMPNSKIDFVFYPITPGVDVESLDLNVSKINFSSSEYKRKSEPYYSINLSLFGPIVTDKTSPFNAFADYQIGALSFNNVTTGQIQKYLNNSKVILYDTYGEMYNAFKKGRINYILANTFSTQNDIIQEELQLYPLEITIPMNIFISDNAPENTEELLNTAIKQLSIQDINNIVFNNSYFTHDMIDYMDKTTSYDFQSMVQMVIIVTGSVVLFLALCFIIYRKHIERIAFTDNLTGFYTSAKFNLSVSKLLKNAKLNQYILVSIDVDKFQVINELCSFSTGTVVIKRLAKYIEEFYSKAVYISRSHADNFILLLENDGSEIELSKYDKLDFSDIDELNFPVYISQGVFVIDNPEEEFTTMIGAVNQARQSAKQVYGNTLVVHEKQMDKAHKTQNRIISKMDMALKDREFQVYYQPKISLSDRKICGAESLVRWQTSDGSMIFPDEFIPLFEKNRYIIKLDAYVFDATCEFIAHHREELDGIVISVNLSTVSLMQDDLVISLVKTLKYHEVPIRCVELEVTESAFVEDVDLMLKRIGELRKAGFTLSLDDFGSGISSLNQLKNLDLDIIKIDKNFLQNSIDEEKGILIIENIIELSKKLDLKIVAEGVETIEGVELLTRLECDIAQGYYFSRPLPEQQFLSFINDYIPYGKY